MAICVIHYGASAAAFVHQTHKAPAAAVVCCRGDRREQPTVKRAAAKPFRPLAPHEATAYKVKPTATASTHQPRCLSLLLCRPKG